MVSGQILLSGIMLSLYKKEERPMSHECLLLFLFNCRALLCPLLFSCCWEFSHNKEYKWICVDCSCGEQTSFWPRGFVNFVSPFQNPLSTCAFTPLCLLKLKKGHFSVVFPRLTVHLHCVLVDRTHECWTTGSYCLSFPAWRSDLIVSCSWKKPWSLSSGLFWMLAFQFTFH